MEKRYGFRGWYYFRQGWSLYFAFILAAINTLTVTYYLAIDNIPELQGIFPSFAHYIVSAVVIGIPLLVFVGYLHYKKTSAYRNEMGVVFESNPFQRRMLVNSEVITRFQLELSRMLLKLNSSESISAEEKEKILKMHDEVTKMLDERTLTNAFDKDYLNSIK
ncbi:MAG: hypothetical protein CL763_07790 [Chloroflexi bacterium]|nr:hypothetical protein [Chloroflexota bacterium]|tara:strand:+ start:10994 stop:11482 length:489 start_codon:yes stop_codon:yes gene_type:complete